MKGINNSWRKHKRNHEREEVCISRYRVLLIFINFNFHFLNLYKMYFQNYFANRSIKLESFTSHLQHSRPSGAARAIIGWANIHICAFCLINFFWNRLFLQSVNTNIWIFAPSIIVLPAPVSRPCCISYTTLAFAIGSSLYMLIQHDRSCCKWYLKVYSERKTENWRGGGGLLLIVKSMRSEVCIVCK